MIRTDIAHLPTSAPEGARLWLSAELDATETAARSISELAWLLSRALPATAGSLTRAYGDLVRDLTAVHLSSARWLFDL
jgi:hypothetical protein